MGVYIPKIKIPKEGYCETHITIVSKDGKGLHVWQTLDDKEAKDLGAEEDETYERIIGKAIEIPTPHGRLIDAKVFADTINEAIQNGSFITKSIWEWITDAPTIIEAEEE